jgi:2-C-methyl-D-erythritol 4-phosphate cytidylyltransferase
MKLFHFGREKRQPHCAAIIVAAGSATRMQGIDKIMANLMGQPVIVHTIRAFQNAACIDEIVVVARWERIKTIEALCHQYDLTKVRAIVEGGDTRMASVAAGLRALSKKATLAAIQDGARPLVAESVISAVVAAAAVHHAAAPAIPVKDTIKVMDSACTVEYTPERDTLRAVQTPQVFDRDLLLAAWERARKEKLVYTDDCGAMEGLGVKVYLTEGSEENIKITTPLDLKIAELILKERV